MYIRLKGEGISMSFHCNLYLLRFYYLIEAKNIKASEEVFAGVTIDPNPFTQLLATLTDMKDTMITFVTDGLTPMISAFNQSKNAAIALIAVLVGIVGSKIFPAI